MKYAILALFFAVNAKAGIPAASSPGSSSGGISNGQDFNGDDGVFKTLSSTGTSPSLTATGIVAGAGSSITATGFLVGVGGVKAPHLTAVGSTYGGGVGYVAPGAVDVAINSGSGGTVQLYDQGVPIILTNNVGTVLNNNASATVDFRVKCDTDEYCLFVDASAEKVGIGTASPNAKLDVAGEAEIGGAGTAPAGRAYQASDYLRLPAADVNTTDRTNVRWAGGGRAAPSNANADSNGDKMVFYNDGSGKVAVGAQDSYAMWLQANGHATAEIGFNVGATGTPVAAVAIVSTGGLRTYSRTIAQLMAIAPITVGEQFFCNNCSPAKIVVSTGTSAGNFADAIGGAFQ